MFICTYAHIFTIDSKPKLHELLVFQDDKGRSFNFANEIGTEYRIFGILLLQDGTGATVNALELKHRQVAKEINVGIMTAWIQGRGIRPVTWATLSDVLDDAGLCALSEKIKQALRDNLHFHKTECLHEECSQGTYGLMKHFVEFSCCFYLHSIKGYANTCHQFHVHILHI